MSDTTEGQVSGESTGEGEGQGTGESTAADKILDEGQQQQQTDDKGGDQKAAEKDGEDKGEKGEKDGEDKAGAPEEYGEFTFPEGINPSSEMVTEFSTIAKELDLDQATAQRFVDLQGKFELQRAEAAAQAWEDTISGWLDEAKADKDLGGDKWDETMAVCARAMEAFGSPELKEALNFSGLGNHLAVIAFVHAIGSEVSEDGFRATGRAGKGETSAADAIFGDK